MNQQFRTSIKNYKKNLKIMQLFKTIKSIKINSKKYN